MTILLALTGVARAQTFDAHGPALPPDGPSVRDPVLGFGANVPGAPVIGLVGEAADALLVREVTDGATVTETPVLDDLFGLGLDVSVPVVARVSVGATLPIWLASEGEAGGGAALGDAHVWVPVRLTERGARLAVVPFLRLPTGADARLLGDPGVGAGLLASAGADVGILALNLDAGVDGGVASGAPDWPGGLSGRFAGAIGMAPLDALAFHLEVRGRAPLFRELFSVPTEGMVTVKARPGPRFGFTGGVGTALTSGIGAGGLRLAVGAHAALGKNDVDAAVVEAAAPAELHVIDERRWPVRGAVVRVGGATATTDHEGYADLPPRTWKVGRIDVEAPGFEPAAIPDLAPESMSWEVVLVRKAVPVAVSVVGPSGATEDVVISLTGPGEVGAPTVDEAGVRNYALRPGTWTATMEAPGLGRQERTIVVGEERTEPMRVDAVLAAAGTSDNKVVVRVVDETGAPVEDAVVALGEADLGTTGTGGDVVVHGLAPGATSFTVRSPAHTQDAVVQAVVTKKGDTEILAVLASPPGAVRVRVTGPDGRPADARVFLNGPASLPSRAVGSDGEELFVLRPGQWDVLVSAPSLGSQQRRIAVTEQPGVVTELAFTLLPEEPGTSELEVQVIDVDGLPLPEVAVTLDGVPAGRTGPDGRLVLLGLQPGERAVGIEGELLVPKVVGVDVASGRQVESITAWFVGGVVDVRVADRDGRAVPGQVTFSGPTPVPPVAVGPDGNARAVLTPGKWEVTVANDALGTQVRDVVVALDDRRNHRVSVTLLPEGDDLGHVLLTAVDPVGRPLVGAWVSVDGRPVGALSHGPLKLDLPLGDATIVVEAELMVPVTQPIEIVDLTPVNVVLPWATGVLEVKVSGPAGPTDALVALTGPEPVASQEATDGTTRFGLTPGTWYVLATRPGFAADERSVVIPEAPGLTAVHLELEPVAEDEGELLISVQDPDGRPIPGVSAVVKGASLGRTSEGGTVSLADLSPGKVEVALSAPPGFLGRDLPFRIEKGEQDQLTVVLPYAPLPVQVQVVAEDGAPVDAVVRVSGPSDEIGRSGADGATEMPLTPGVWTVTAETASGVATTEIVVERGKPTPVVALAVVPTASTIAGGVVRLPTPILFDTESHLLRSDLVAILDDVARRIKADREASLIEVQGHTSNDGGVAYNQALSERRAEAVKAALIARGVPAERLLARGYGLSRPVTTGTDDASRQRNRRVELVVLESAP